MSPGHLILVDFKGQIVSSVVLFSCWYTISGASFESFDISEILEMLKKQCNIVLSIPHSILHSVRKVTSFEIFSTAAK